MVLQCVASRQIQREVGLAKAGRERKAILEELVDDFASYFPAKMDEIKFVHPGILGEIIFRFVANLRHVQRKTLLARRLLENTEHFPTASYAFMGIEEDISKLALEVQRPAAYKTSKCVICAMAEDTEMLITSMLNHVQEFLATVLEAEETSDGDQLRDTATALKIAIEAADDFEKAVEKFFGLVDANINPTKRRAE